MRKGGEEVCRREGRKRETERSEGVQILFCGVSSQAQYVQMELLRTSRDNDTGKMQQLMKMFAVSRATSRTRSSLSTLLWESLCFNL